MAPPKSQKRLELGEEGWTEYVRLRKLNEVKKWQIKNAERYVNYREETKRKLIAYKGGVCEICGYSKDCPQAYDFHHPDPTKKDYSVSSKSRSFDSAKNEVDKCQLLCRNCHAEVHYALNKVKKAGTIEKLSLSSSG